MVKKKPRIKPKGDESMRDGWLFGWKAIANFMGCSTKTAQDYERRLRLPVYTIPGPNGSEIRAAIPAKLNEWLEKSKKV